jgi:hypothetical protein
VLELTNVVLVWTHSELRTTSSLKVDALDLTFSVLCIDFGRSAQKAKGDEPARMRFDLQIRCFEKIGAVDKGAKGQQENLRPKPNSDSLIESLYKVDIDTFNEIPIHSADLELRRK